MYDFRTFTFGVGAHESREEGMCIMEAVAYVAGEKHSDHPECACPVISAFLRSWNDGILNHSRRKKLLAPFVFRLVGTKSTPEMEVRRSYMALDWLIRVHAPAWLDLTPGLAPHAPALRSLPEIKDLEGAIAAAETIKAVCDAASTAASTTTNVAATKATRAAARDAAYWATDCDAACDAAKEASWLAIAAARAAAKPSLKKTERTLQDSAADLVGRMIRLTEPQEVVPARRRRVKATA